MKAVAVIPARGGSRRLPRKNIRPFFDKPIIEYSIRAAERSQVFDRIVVSTEDQEIAEVAAGFGAWVVYRPLKLAEDNIGTQEVMTNTVGLFACEFACCVYPTAPLMSSRDIIRGYDELRRDEANLYAFAVGTDPLRDAGQFYWARTIALLRRKPLIAEYSVMIPIDEKRVVDINVEYDWKKAECMYEKLEPWEKHL